LKDAFKSHFGHVTSYFSDGEKTNSLAETPETPETHSIFDDVKSKINFFGGFMNSIDSPQTEENQIETIVTQTYMEGSQPPITNTIVMKTYESGDESIHQSTNGEMNNVIFNTNRLLQNGNQKIDKIITEMKNDFNSNENSSYDSNIEDYDDDNDDETMDDDEETMDDDDDDDGTMDDDERTMIDDDEDIKEDFNKVMQESMVLQVS